MRRDVAVIGASAGGIPALRVLVSRLPDHHSGCVLVAVHMTGGVRSLLAEVLSKAGPLMARLGEDGDPIRPGEIIVAPPDHHLLVYGGTMRVTRGPRENGFRPAIDSLFRTAARSHGPRVVAVVLSGLLSDGAWGLQEVKRLGGTTVVQDTHEALFPSMPLAALRAACVDHELPAAAIGDLLASLSEDSEPVETVGAGRIQNDRAERGTDELAGETEESSAYGLTCPECGGTLLESDQHRGRYTCHVGHAYSRDALLLNHDDAVERALWAALRSLRESALLRRTMASRAREGGLDGLAQRYEARAREAQERTDAIREVLTTDPPTAEATRRKGVGAGQP